MYPRRIWQERLTLAECVRGVAMSVLYFLVFPFAMAWVQRTTGEELPAAEASVVYYFISVVLVFLLFWRFLKRNFNLLLERLPENLTAAAIALALWTVAERLVRLIPLPVENPNDSTYAMEYLLSPRATVVILVVLMPIVEEMLFRGLLFGGVRRYSRLGAYFLSVVLFGFYSVWQFTFSYGVLDLRYLLLFVQYLPAGLALSWCYDRGGSVWSAVLLHMAINGLTLLRLVP